MMPSHLGGDTIIVISYAQYDEADLERYEPRVVHVAKGTNTIIDVDAAVATLLGTEDQGARLAGHVAGCGTP